MSRIKKKSFKDVFGPGFITTKADNDAGAVTSYLQAGSLYGWHISWVMLLLLPITYFCQITTAKIAIATNTGLISIIKEKLGKTWANLTVANLSFLNFLTLLTQFAALTNLCEVFNVNKYIAIPAIIVSLCVLFAPSNYNKWEKTMIYLCCFDIFWIILGAICGENGNFRQSKNFSLDGTYLLTIMALIGTTIAPWQLFFQNSCTVDKNLKKADFKNIKIETFIGAVFIIISGIIMIYLGSFVPNGINGSAQFVKSLSASGFIELILSLLIINASIVGASAVSICTSWVYAENKNLDRSLNEKFSEAPWFYSYYYGSIIVAGLFTLLPSLPLNYIILGVQVVACVFLPYQLVIMQLICNDSKLMGTLKNSKKENIIMNSVILILVILSICLLGKGLSIV